MLLCIKTNQDVSFLGICGVHRRLSTMHMVLYNLTINPSVLYCTTGLTKMPGMKATVPLE